MKKLGMVRKQVYVEPRHERLLKRWAKQRGVSEAELIRAGIEELGRTAPVPAPDAQAWVEELAFMRRRQRELAPLGERRRWTREELYAGRIGRVPG